MVQKKRVERRQKKKISQEYINKTESQLIMIIDENKQTNMFIIPKGLTIGQ
jgi:hypothetical protein